MNNQTNLTFSIITPTFNRSDFLERILKTLNPQSIYISEWIVIDDGSNDKTYEVISKLKKISSINIIYQYSSNRGMTNAINIGLKYVCLNVDFTLGRHQFEIVQKTYYEKLNLILKDDLNFDTIF